MRTGAAFDPPKNGTSLEACFGCVGFCPAGGVVALAGASEAATDGAGAAEVAATVELVAGGAVFDAGVLFFAALVELFGAALSGVALEAASELHPSPLALNIKKPTTLIDSVSAPTRAKYQAAPRGSRRCSPSSCIGSLELAKSPRPAEV